MKFAHRDCGGIVAEYLGDDPVRPGLVMRSSDWYVLGERPAEGSVRGEVVCPKCNMMVGICPRDLIEVTE
jgi:hypothetical protein